MESALNASWQHYQRTGRALYITPATVMSNETFEELEDPEQFNDPDLLLPEELTGERLWAERQQAINGGLNDEDEDELPGIVNGLSYFPCPMGYAPAVPQYSPPANGVDGSSQPLVGNPLLALGETQSPIGDVNEACPTDVANGETSTSQSSTTAITGLSSKTQTSTLTDVNLAFGFALDPLSTGKQELPFDIGEYLTFEDDNEDNGKAENRVDLENDEETGICGGGK